MATWSDVRKIALALPGTSEDRSRDHAAWLVNKKFFVWERPLRKSDLAALGERAPKGAVLGVRTADLEMKDVLIAHDPRVYFTIPHFDGYPAVLVLLEKISSKELQRVVREAWLARASTRAVKEFLQEPRKRAGRKKSRA